MAARDFIVGTAFARDKSFEFYNAASYGNDSKVVSMFADARVDVNVVDKWGNSPFMRAAHSGHTSVVAKFLGCEKVEVNAMRKVRRRNCPVVGYSGWPRTDCC
jgi:hypothetical protein